MKRILYFLIPAILLTVFSAELFAQTGINTDGSQPAPSSMLDVKSDNKGFLIPRVALVSADSELPMNGPLATGLLVYNTVYSGNSPQQLIPGFYYWDGTRWIPWSTPSGVLSGDMLFWNGASWVILPPGLQSEKLIFCNGFPVWGGCLALLITSPPQNITNLWAHSGGSVSNSGGSEILSRGVCWGTSPNPDISGNKTTDGAGMGEFVSFISGLQGNTQYYLRAYATNSKGTAYGNEFVFTTPVNSFAPTSIGGQVRSCPSSVITIPVYTKNFISVGGFNLTLGYDATALTFQNFFNDSGFPGMAVTEMVPGKLSILGHSDTVGVTLADSSVLLSLNFNYEGDSIPLHWVTESDSCVYYGYPGYIPMIQQPVTDYYISGVVREIPSKMVEIVIAATSTHICAGTMVSFSSTIVNGGLNPQYQWLLNGTEISGATGSSYSYAPLNGDVIYCRLLSNIECPTGNPAISNSIVVVADPVLPVSVSISSTGTTVCEGTSVSFTASGLNGGQNPSYQWVVNGVDVTGATNASYSYVPVNGNTVSCRFTSSDSCATGSPAMSNMLVMTVNPILTAGVSITPSSNPSCSGASVIFSAVPVNGGSLPTYQWRVNGSNVSGATNPTYSFIPANGNSVNCIMVSNAQCILGNPATSNSVTMTVNPLKPVSIAIGSNSNTVCNGSTVKGTAVPTNGGTAPTYQWRVNSTAIPGATANTYTFYPSNSDTLSCILLSNIQCATGNPATSNKLVISVLPLLPVSISIASNASQVCAGTPVSFTSAIVNGGNSPAYKWRLNGVNIAGATTSTYSFVPVNNNAISCELTSNATCKSGSPALSNVITPVVNPYLPVSVNISATSGNVCAGTNVVFSATPVNGGNSPAFQWWKNGVLVAGSTNSTYSYMPLHGDVVYCVVHSSESCPTGNPATSNSITMTVNPANPVSVSVLPSVNPSCDGIPVTYTSTTVNGGSDPSYQWMVNGVNVAGATNSTYTYQPVNGDAVKVVVNSTILCATGNPATSAVVSMTVNPILPVGVTIMASSQQVCAGTAVTFTATPQNGGQIPLYQWQVNNLDIAGATLATYQYTPVHNDLVKCRLTSNATCPSGNPATSSGIVMTVDPVLPVSVSISASGNPVCIGSTVLFTAAPVNGGLNPTFRWSVNDLFVSGATNGTFSYVPSHGDHVRCELTSNLTCPAGNPALSDIISMTVNNLLPVSISISASSTVVCDGTSVHLTANPVNGGTLPAYQWRVNNGDIPGATNSSFTYIPVNGDDVTCKLTSNAFCISGNPAISNHLVITVNPLLPAGVGISTPLSTVCAGTTVTCTATPVNGGQAPAYQWRITNVPVSGATNVTFTYLPANHDTITCLMTSNATCTTGNPAVSNPLVMVVNPLLPVSVAVSTSGNVVCAGTQVNFTTVVTNGGGSPMYQWRVNSASVPGATNSSYSFTPNHGDAVSCVVTSSVACPSGSPATSNTVVMTVNPLLPTSVSVSVTSNTVCAGTQVVCTATPVNGGTAPSFQWKINGTDVSAATNSTFAFMPLNQDVVTCVMTSNAVCATGNPAISNGISLTVNPLLPVSVSVASSGNAVCAGTQVTCTATPVNGGSNPLFQWKKNGSNVSGATSSTYSFIPLNGDIVSCVLNSNALCVTGNPATSNAVSMTVNPILPVSIIIATSGNLVCSGTQVLCTAVAVNGGTAPAYQWRINDADVPGATASTYNFVPASSCTVSCRLTSNATCPGGNPAISNLVNIVVTTVLPVSVVISTPVTEFCAGTQITCSATPTNGGINPVYQWFVKGAIVSGATNSTFSFTPENSDTVFCKLQSSSSCATGNPATSNSIGFKVHPLLPVSADIVTSGNQVCAGSTVSCTAIPTNGGLAPAFQWRINGVNISGATNSTFSFVPVHGDAVSVMLTSSETCTLENPVISHFVRIEVYPLLPVSVVVSTAAKTVCYGTLVSYMASPTNGGSMPLFQWRVNGVNIPGATNSLFSFTPANGDAITCELTSNATCTTGNPAFSNVVTMAVNPMLPVSVTITSSATTVCAGSVVTCTATPINGGTNPAYQWKRNGVNVPGATGSGYIFTPVNGDVVSCVLTSNIVCPSGNPATSNTIQFTVNPALPVSVTISSTGNNVCAGTTITCMAIPLNGGTSPAFQWKVNGGNVAGATNSSFSYIPVNGDAVSCLLTSNAPCTTGNPAISNTINITVNAYKAVAVTISASSNPVCAGTSVTYTAAPVNGGTTPAFQWRLNGNNISGATNQTYTAIPLNNQVISCVLTSNASCVTGNPATSNNVTMIVNQVLAPAVSIAATSTNICTGNQVSFTATPVNGGVTPAYQWQVNGVNVTGATSANYMYTPANSDVVKCSMTSTVACPSVNPVMSNQVNMTVNPLLPVSITISASANTVCSGTHVTFNATVVNGGTNPAYQWRVNGVHVTGATNASYSYVPVNGDLISCVLTSNATCATGNPATSNAIAMTVNPNLNVSVAISSSGVHVCAGTTVQFTASAVNGGSAPVYQWQVNGVNVSGSSSYSFVPLNNDAVRCILTSNVTCPVGNPATSNLVTMTVNPNLPVSVQVNASANPVCPGTPVNYTAVITNGGTSPTYQWQKNGVSISGATNSTYGYIPVNNDQIKCTVASSVACPLGNPATSNTITMSVGQILPAGVTIAPSVNPMCAGSSVEFTATPVNGGDFPLYQWKVNGNTVSGASTATYSFTPVQNDAVQCVMTSSLECATGNPATSNTVTMAVDPLLPVSVSIVSSAETVCAGTMVNFTSTTINGGANPVYQWKVNGTDVAGATSSVFSYQPVHSDAVTVTVHSNAVCPTGNPATSNVITMNVNPLQPVSVNITASSNPVCFGTSVTMIATVVHGGTLPGYQWKVNGSVISGATSAGYFFVPANNDAVSCIVTSNAICASGNPATSNTVSMTVNPLKPVNITVATNTPTVCAGTSVVFTSTATNAGISPIYQWLVNGQAATGATNNTYSYVPVNNDVVACRLTSSESCATGNPATSNAVSITVNPNQPVSITIAAGANPVCAGTVVTFTSNVVNGGSSPAYQWRKNGNNVAGATNATYSYVPLNQDAVSCVVTSNTVCPTGNPATSNTVNMVVNPLQPVGVTIATSSNPVCAGTSATFTSTVVNGGSNPQYQWKVNGTIVTGATNATYAFVPVNNDGITCVVTSNAICPSGNPATSNLITMTVNPLLTVSVSITASANVVCAGTTVSYNATPVNGGTSPVYQWRVNSTNIAGATNSTFSYIPLQSDAVVCVLTSNAVCPTGNPATSNVVSMTVNPLLPVTVSITSSSNPVCAGTSVGYTAFPVNGGTAPSYQWRVNGNLTSGSTSNLFDYIPLNGDVITCRLISNALCPTGNPANSNPVNMVVNPMLPVSVTIVATETSVCSGTSVIYSATAVNGGALPSYQWRVNGLEISGATSSTFSYIPVNYDMVTCRLTSNAICPVGNPAMSNEIVMTVHPLLPVSVTISTNTNPVCAGSLVSFASSVINGGNSPLYQWKVNGVDIPGATNATHQYIPLNGDAVVCVVTSNALCPTGSPATSNTEIMTVNPLEPVAVTIDTPASTVCAGTMVTFTAWPVNGGTMPAYQWKLNGNSVSGATDVHYTFTPVNMDTVSCLLTSNAVCPTGNPAISNPVIITVNPLLPVSVTIAESANTVCAGTQVTYTSSVVNGGTNPTFRWRVNGVLVAGATNSSYSYIPLNGDGISCEVTSNAVCPTGNPAISNTVTMLVNPLLPVSITITASQNPVCAGSTVHYTSNVVNGGTAPTYQWKVNGASVSGATGATYSYAPLNNDQIACVIVSNAICPTGSPAQSNSIVMTVNPLLPVSVSISATVTTVCAGTSVVYTAVPVNGGTIPAYQWRVNGVNISGATNSTHTRTPVNNDVLTCVVTSNAVCPTGNPATSNAIAMTVNPLLPVSVTISTPVNPICNGVPATFTALPVNGGAAPAYQWIKNGVNVAGATNITYSYTPVNADIVKCQLTSNAVCATGSPATSAGITMTVKPLLPVSVTIAASANPVCAGVTVTFTATPVNGGSNPVYQWFVNNISIAGATNSTYAYVPLNNDAIKCTLTSSEQCTTGNPATSNILTMTAIQLTPVSVSIWASAYAVMPGTAVTYTANPVNGGTNPTYQWYKNNVIVTGATNVNYSYAPANNDNLKCVLTSGLSGCLSNNPATSNIVNMIVYTTGTACSATPTVVHGGKTYNAVQIGTQCWLRESINLGNKVNNTVTQTNNGIVEKYCYNNDTNNCNVYGGLYQWAEMVQYLNGVTNTTHWASPLPTNVQGVCPSGWHIPVQTEVDVLVAYLGAAAAAGGKLKESGLVHWGPTYNIGATNTSGFTGLPAGYTYNSVFYYIRENSTMWTVTKGTSASAANYFGMTVAAPNMTGGENNKITGLSVRCLKN